MNKRGIFSIEFIRRTAEEKIHYVDDLIALKRARNHLRDKEDISWLKRNRKDLIKLFPSC